MPPSFALGFPLAERAALSAHTELRPGRALANPASACAAHRGGVPFGAGAAGSFAGSEDVRRGGGEARGCPVDYRLAKAVELIQKSAVFRFPLWLWQGAA